jgi:hypothetical protein
MPSRSTPSDGDDRFILWVHPYLLRSGLWRDMKPGEKDLYLYLMEESERRCTREITATDAQVRAAVGAASRTLCNARKRLQEYGLIHHKSGQGNKYTYVICNPRTGQPYPGEPRAPIVVPKRKGTAQNEQPSPVASIQRDQVQSKFAAPKPSRAQRTALESHGLLGVF